MGSKETSVEKQVQLAVSKHGARLFKNHRGMFKDMQGNPRQIGIGPNGGSDLIGFTAVTITPEMVGRSLAVFTAIECKQGKGRPSPEQLKFIETVKQYGGKAGVAWCAEDAVEIIS